MSARDRLGPGAAPQIAARARLAVGTRFRPQGRTPAEGLDCIGLVAFALGLEPGDVPRDYALRSSDPVRLGAELSRRLRPAGRGSPQEGDVAVYSPGLRQVHLGVVSAGTLVHADCGLMRVVERPLPAPWPLVELWRVADDERSL